MSVDPFFLDPDRGAPSEEPPRKPRWPWVVGGVVILASLFVGALLSEPIAWVLLAVLAVLNLVAWFAGHAIGLDQYGAWWFYQKPGLTDELLTGEVDRSFWPRTGALLLTILSLVTIWFLAQRHPAMIDRLSRMHASTPKERVGDKIHDALLK